MKKFLLLLFASLATISLYSQTKKYEGPYTISGGGVSGNVVYEYIENPDYTRIKQGIYKFTNSRVSITGQYDNNLKTGHWITKVAQQGNSSQVLDIVKYDLNWYLLGPKGCTVTGDYIEGKRTGKWTVLAESRDCKYTSSINFKEGKCIGDFNAKLISKDDSKEMSSLTGSFLEGGIFDGVWTYKYHNINGIEYIKLLTFDNGLLLTEKVINLSTGDSKIETISEKGASGNIVTISSLTSDSWAVLLATWESSPTFEYRGGYSPTEEDRIYNYTFIDKHLHILF